MAYIECCSICLGIFLLEFGIYEAYLSLISKERSKTDNSKLTLKELSEKTDTFLISTELIPQRKEEFQSWPYLGFSHGQHISFFAEKSFEILAGQLQMNYFRVGEYLHLFSKKKIQLRNLDRNKKFEYCFSKIQFFLSLIFKNEYYWLHIKRYQDYHRSK